MGIEIRLFRESDREAVIALALRAWEPVHASLRRVLGEEVYPVLVPDWRRSQYDEVAGSVDAGDQRVWVAEADGAVAGFATARMLPDDDMGEIHLLAVDPDHQGRGVGTALTGAATDWIREQGAAVAMVETGGDDGHAPARATYERAGYTALPIVRYFRKL
ncbi:MULTISPECIES: GNAT family N-acetyltransferase [Nocardiopsis]|jgi:GNAT superfamily N-acetyltransferase|uniref:GCN5-related N-acetyltransferase n=1 Tax=Nocardiopsis dassonvillei (strain ATCC 23218 / DSM 43111 / CIP 107115 / JCM 7437 / KCTC 9190 / NBRC 14626 / NCTC 10488 / NRRL B-5397 / IMRU 509) TaxID=446468 RepID=D7AV45_NOCDD|nr:MULTISPECIES: GNAT family N-acetyltransferase [Nocardiopsis]ADH69595.1 GCN5-related N-acetyltransferase [Nocardiopsis dassonvillei subsp. dassonvillei DSM 43111]APC37595.1 GNAT family N-acetyltransferase [Nocardiopsis dassonvillei]NKY81676.1 GNAT family N-acetyltransferase [Nocardiopsis dassonvillei]VEI90107.1 putative acetyltransferase [Nocardiopsis dassonvillei]